MFSSPGDVRSHCVSSHGLNIVLSDYSIGLYSLIARFMGPAWGPSGADRTQVGPMLPPWTLLSGLLLQSDAVACLLTSAAFTWKRRCHCMMTSSNGNLFRVTGHLCGEFTGPGEFPAQRPVTRSFDVFFDLDLNKRLSKQSWGWWFETPSWSLWRHCNGLIGLRQCQIPVIIRGQYQNNC